MRILLSLILLISLKTETLAANVLRPPSLLRPQSLILQSFKQISALQREIDMLVARGYMLFAGEFPNNELEGVIGKEFILIRDMLSPVYRYGENQVATRNSSHKLTSKGISEGGRAPLGGDGKDVNVDNLIYIPWGETDLQKSRFGWYHYRLETTDGSYPELPAEIESFKLLTPAHTVEMRPVKHFRIYQGEKPLQDIVPGIVGKVRETITINGNNPYVVYRHTQVIRESGEVSDRLSVAIYPYISLQPHLLKEEAVIIEGTDAVGSKKYQLFSNVSDDSNNITLNYGSLVTDSSTKIPLQLIKQSDIWNEHEGKLGATGAGIEKMHKYNYFNGESSDGK